jgi:hypothetical protein
LIALPKQIHLRGVRGLGHRGLLRGIFYLPHQAHHVPVRVENFQQQLTLRASTLDGGFAVNRGIISGVSLAFSTKSYSPESKHGSVI